MDESVKTLVSEALPDIERELFGRTFQLEEACDLVTAYMFRRYGVSNYQCSKDVKSILTGQFDAAPKIKRADAGDVPAWAPAG